MKLGRNQEIWLQTLEMGVFKQGKMFLHKQDDDSRCCLGVAAEIFKDKSTDVRDRNVGLTHTLVTGYDREYAAAPKYVVDLLGLRDNLGAATRPGHMSLSHLNDQLLTHAEIAEVIRIDPSLYFSDPR